MNESQSGGEPSAFADTTATVRNGARDVRDALHDGRPAGRWKAILGDLVREAPLSSLAVAFVVGIIVARR